jgi:putative membrane protein insertion efficiency factor
MSALRKRLREPQSYLVAMLLAAAVACGDGMRPAEKQWTAWAYVAAVHVYQRDISADLSRGGHVRCRFEPTCSHYSVEAVRRFGIGKGLVLTANRLWRCRASVPLGTKDDVPEESDQSSAMRDQ